MSGGRLRVLVLDDDPMITELVAEVLGSACAVTATTSFEEAESALAHGSDVLICDYIINGSPSASFLETVAARHVVLRRVLMTGSPEHEWQSLLDRGIVVAVLLKPFELHQLWAVIRLDD